MKIIYRSLINIEGVIGHVVFFTIGVANICMPPDSTNKISIFVRIGCLKTIRFGYSIFGENRNKIYIYNVFNKY
ncbi:MAG TPA: hypothetical protein DDZ41_09650 [Flavobacterium sp.]|nr:hypothetical protein [Flavobacterium sp.]